MICKSGGHDGWNVEVSGCVPWIASDKMILVVIEDKHEMSMESGPTHGFHGG